MEVTENKIIKKNPEAAKLLILREVQAVGVGNNEA